MITYYKQFIFLCSILFIFSCAQISSFQTAKPTPKDEGEIGVSLNITGVSETLDGNGESFALPSMELWGRYGLGKKTDIGLKINTGLSAVIDLKHQIIGDQSSKFALAIGGGIGLQAIILSKAIIQAHLPLHMSYHPTERAAVYLTPRYIYQGVIGDGGVNYLGFSTGVIFGKKVKFGFDLSYSKIADNIAKLPGSFIDDDLGSSLYQFGFGVKFPIK